MRRWLVGALTLLLAGCGGVLSEHAASDDTTTQVDARLVGFWRVDWEASGAKGGGEADQGLFAVGKRKAPDTGLELAVVMLDKEGTLEVQRAALRATAIAGKSYVSIDSTPKPKVGETAPEGANPKPQWAICRYEVPEPGVLRILVMDVPTVAKDVNEKKVSGTVPPPGQWETPDTVTINLSATTYALRAWLEGRGDAVFKVDKPLVLRRIDLR
jgi:hypothetical protein